MCIRDSCKLNKTKKEILKEITTFEDLIFKEYQKRPIFYVTTEFYEDFLIDKFLHNPIWFRSIFGKPKLSDNREWQF